MMNTKVIDGTNGKYQISDEGEIVNIDTGFRLNPFDRKGYLSVDIRINGRLKYLTVHRLVAITFLGEPPEGMQVNHKNMNKHDNRASNLEYLTQHENILHAWRNGAVAARGEKAAKHKLTEQNVVDILRMHKNGMDHVEIARAMNGIVSRSNISYITLRKTWKHVALEN